MRILFLILLLFFFIQSKAQEECFETDISATVAAVVTCTQTDGGAGFVQYTDDTDDSSIVLEVEGDLTIDANFRIVEDSVIVSGTLTVNGNLGIGEGGVLYILPEGIVNVNGNVTLNPGADNGPSTATIQGTLDATGNITVNEGATIQGGGNVDDADGIIDGVGTITLPVELAYFQVTNEGTAGVRLNWKTYSELNNEGFEIERSDDGANFYKIGFVEGKGTTNQVQEYNFQDPALVFDYAYYRLKQIDFDGQFEYSDIALATSVDLSFSEFNVYPNPTLGLFNVTYPIQNYSLYDQGGSLLIKSDATTFVYAQDQIQQFLSSATNGIYYLSSLIEGENRVLRIVLDK